MRDQIAHGEISSPPTDTVALVERVASKLQLASTKWLRRLTRRCSGRAAEGVGLVRINRPDVRNALNLDVRKLLAQHLTEMGDDPAIRCIVLTGNEKSF